MFDLLGTFNELQSYGAKEILIFPLIASRVEYNS